jgi:hypothetical protein
MSKIILVGWGEKIAFLCAVDNKQMQLLSLRSYAEQTYKKFPEGL